MDEHLVRPMLRHEMDPSTFPLRQKKNKNPPIPLSTPASTTKGKTSSLRFFISFIWKSYGILSMQEITTDFVICTGVGWKMSSKWWTMHLDGTYPLRRIDSKEKITPPKEEVAFAVHLRVPRNCQLLQNVGPRREQEPMRKASPSPSCTTWPGGPSTTRFTSTSPSSIGPSPSLFTSWIIYKAQTTHVAYDYQEHRLQPPSWIQVMFVYLVILLQFAYGDMFKMTIRFMKTKAAQSTNKCFPLTGC